MCIIIFSKAFHENIPHYKNNSAVYYHKYIGLHAMNL